MSIDFNFRKAALKSVTNAIGVYILADLDNIPIYVGQSTDGIRKRVGRHLTSARSDIIANRQIDVWEIAYIWAYPVENSGEISQLEARLFHHYDPSSQLINGSVPKISNNSIRIPEPAQIVQVVTDNEIFERKSEEQRLPRQANHYAQIVGHFLVVKNSTQIARAMNAHFERLKKYHSVLLSKAINLSEDKGED